MFNKLFRPKIEHADAGVRLAAVKKLNPVKQAPSLLDLAENDPDRSVRLAAINRLDNLEALISLLGKQHDEQLVAASQERIDQLLKANKPISTNQAAMLFGRLNDSQLKKLLISKLSDDNALDTLINATNDQDDLALLAANTGSASARKLAASKITNLDALKAVQHQSKDKSIQHIVRQKLHEIKQQQKQELSAWESLAQICTALERLARLDYDSIYTSRLHLLENHWDDIDEQYKSNYQARYNQALIGCQRIVAQSKQAHELDKLHQYQNELCSALCESLAEKIEQTDLKNIEQWPTWRSNLEQQWQDTTKNSSPDAQINQHYLNLIDAADCLSKLVLAYQQAQINQLAEQQQQSIDAQTLKTNEKVLHQIIQASKWTYSTPQPLLVKQLSIFHQEIKEQLSKQRKKLNQQKNEISNKSGLLKSFVRQKNLIKANRLFNYIQNLISQLPVSEQDKQQQQLAPVLVDLEQLRGLHRFATTPKKETLCEQMQALVGIDLPAPQLMTKIKNLQDKWKSLAASDSRSDDLLWDQFKQAADKAYEPCVEYLKDLEKLKHSNLDKRRQMVDQLNSYIENVVWDKADWKLIQADFNQFGKKFRALQPIFFADNNPIEKQFEALMSQIKEKLKNEKDENHAIYAGLIERAKLLAELEPDQTEQAIEKIKLLQVQWKNVGLTFYNKSNNQWQEFRGICDQLFTRQHEIVQSKRDQESQHADQAFTIINQIRDLSKVDDEQLPTTQTQFQELIEEYKNLQEMPPSRQEKLSRSFRQACDQYEQHLSGLSQRIRAQTHDSIRRAAVICVEAENLAMAGSDIQEFEQLSQLYAQLKPLPKAINGVFDRRIELARKVLESNDSYVVDTLNAHASTLAALAIELEVLFDIESPDEAKSQRMQYQLMQLQSGIKAPLDKKHKLEKLIATELVWYEIGAVQSEKRRELEERLAAVIASGTIQPE